MELRTVDPLSWVRQRTEQFFPTRRIDPLCLLAYVMADVIELGRGECHISGRDSWWFIASDVDWLLDARFSIQELFANVVPAPGHGPHSLRAEILLNVFATDLFIWNREGHMVIKGDMPGLELVTSVVQ